MQEPLHSKLSTVATKCPTSHLHIHSTNFAALDLCLLPIVLELRCLWLIHGRVSHLNSKG